MASANPAELVALQYKRIQELEQQHAEELSSTCSRHHPADASFFFLTLASASAP
jgi:hypothetical protein